MNNDGKSPPLTALRAFEAAARHMSFAGAAGELHVTPAALSFQIKSLEAHLGAPVFIRLNRKVELTEVGAVLAANLSDGFEILQNAWGAALRKLDQKHLTVTAGPIFMSSWLAPRMSGFVLAHPELELRLTASLRFLNFQRDDIDLAVRFGTTSDAGYFSEPLFQEWATPMMAPELAKRVHSFQDLNGMTFIQQSSQRNLAALEEWKYWCEAVGIATPTSFGPKFSTPDAAMSYAINGGGVVMGRASLAQSHLEAGRLVAPFAQCIRPAYYYRLVCPIGTEITPAVQTFRDWIRQEFKSLEALSEGQEFYLSVVD